MNYRRIAGISGSDYETCLIIRKDDGEDDGLIVLTARIGFRWTERDWVSIVRRLIFEAPEAFKEWPDVRRWLQYTDDERIHQWQLLDELNPRIATESLSARERRRLALRLDPDGGAE